MHDVTRYAEIIKKVVFETLKGLMPEMREAPTVVIPQVIVALLDVAQTAADAAHISMVGALVSHLVLIEPDEEKAVDLLRKCYAIHRSTSGSQPGVSS